MESKVKDNKKLKSKKKTGLEDRKLVDLRLYVQMHPPKNLRFLHHGAQADPWQIPAETLPGPWLVLGMPCQETSS